MTLGWMQWHAGAPFLRAFELREMTFSLASNGGADAWWSRVWECQCRATTHPLVRHGRVFVSYNLCLPKNAINQIIEGQELSRQAAGTQCDAALVIPCSGKTRDSLWPKMCHLWLVGTWITHRTENTFTILHTGSHPHKSLIDDVKKALQ